MLNKVQKKIARDSQLDQNFKLSTQWFCQNRGEGLRNGTYQTLRLHYCPHLESKRNTYHTDPDKRRSYQHLRFTGVGDLSGKQPIWKESLLYKIKQANKKGIKMAIGITMYNEDWKLFLRTITGVCQGLIDIYNDEKAIYQDAGK